MSAGHRHVAGWVGLTVVGLICIAMITGSAFFGSVRLDFQRVFNLSSTQAFDAGQAEIFWRVRVPRTLLAAAAGAGLSLAGVVLQTLFRNPLADPYTVGIASGAALGAAAGIALGLGGATVIAGVEIPRVLLLSFGGAVVAVALVMLIARLRAGRDMTRILLAGICIAYACGAGVMLLQYFGDRAVTAEIVFWLIGAVDRARSSAWIEVFAVTALSIGYLLMSHRALDLLALGDDVAATRGVPVSRVVWTCFTLVGVLTAVIVANCGPIAFVGLMIPNLVRAVFGQRTLPLLIASTFVGGAFLAIGDAVARTLLATLYGSSQELPVGVITQLVGAAFLFGLLLRGDRVLVAR